MLADEHMLIFLFAIGSIPGPTFFNLAFTYYLHLQFFMAASVPGWTFFKSQHSSKPWPLSATCCGAL
jgi:hypothetical protein